MIRPEDVYRIGRIGKTHGLRGELQMQVDDDVFDRVEADYVILSIDGILVPFFMDEYRFKNDDIALVKFCDIDDSQRARELTGCDVFFPRRLAESDDHDLTYAQLIGYQVIQTATGHVVGTIVSIDDTTDNLLFELDNDLLLPAPDEFIDDVDTGRHIISMTLPEGLLQL